MAEKKTNYGDIPDVDSEEFKKFIKDHGFEAKEYAPTNKVSTNNTSFGQAVSNKVEKWCTEHSGLTFAIVIGGSTILSYKLLQSFVAKAVFKGNLKTLRYLERLGR